jgi:hypothetical protein
MTMHPVHKLLRHHRNPTQTSRDRVQLGPLVTHNDEDVTLVKQLLGLTTNDVVDCQDIGMKLVGDKSIAETSGVRIIAVNTSWQSSVSAIEQVAVDSKEE